MFSSTSTRTRIPPQNDLLRALTRIHQNVTAVGDEDQSIYSFRGADISNILRFEQDFPGAQVIKLEQNYRSTQVILDAASAVISCNAKRRPKKLWTERQGGESGFPLYCRRCEDRGPFRGQAGFQSGAGVRMARSECCIAPTFSPEFSRKN